MLNIDVPGNAEARNSADLYPQNLDDNRLDDALTALGLASPKGVGGPGLPGLGLAGDWLEALKRWLQANFGQYWWLLLLAVLALVIGISGGK